MELNFDKEMDALLRQAARSGEAVSAGTPEHLDADEISAFAENALPEKARSIYVKHLADCDRCRSVLSNLVLLNRESETASPAAAPVEIVEAKTPWYRRLLATPNLAYTLGGLALLFGGFLGYLILQSSMGPQSVEISQAPKDERMSGPSTTSDEPFYNSNAANAVNANMSLNSAANTSIAMSNTTSANLSNSAANTSVAIPSPELLATERRDESQRSAKEQNEVKPRTEELKAKNEKNAVTNQAAGRESEPAEVAAAQDRAVQAAPPAPAGRTEMQEERTDDQKLQVKRRAESLPGTARRVSGKTFNRRDGVWYDAAYRGQSTTNVRRNTETYRKLDAGLRVIAESLEGTVVVVWKEKAYRIQ